MGPRETRLKKKIEELGGICVKWTSPSTNGVPDRIVVLEPGWIDFVEVKEDGDYLSPVQKVMHKLLRRLGCRAYVIDCDDMEPYVSEGIYYCGLNNYLKNRSGDIRTTSIPDKSL